MIDIGNLSPEEMEMLKKYFLEKRIIQIKDILKPIEEFFWKFDFNGESQAYELYLGVPKDWLHDMTMSGYKIELVSESEGGKIIKLLTTSDENTGDLDEMVLFAVDIIQRNNAILAKIKEKEHELQVMKDRMVEIQMGLDREIEILKKIKNGEPPEAEVEEETEEEVEAEKVVEPVVVKPVEKVVEKEISQAVPAKIATKKVTPKPPDGPVYKAPINMSQEEADKFVELVRNGKK